MNPAANRVPATALVACLLISLTVSAREVAGTSIPEAAALGPEATRLVLNGAGVRKKFLLNIYVAGLYLPESAGTPAEVLAMAGPKRVLMHFVYDEVTKEQINDAWKEGFENNQEIRSQSALSERLEAFKQFFDTLHAGDEILLDYIPNEGTRVTIRNEYKGTITGEDFYKALLEVWLGKDPVDNDLKEALLGAG